VETDVDLDSDDMVAALLGKTEYDLDLDAMIYSGKGAAVLHRDETGQTINRLPHLSAVIALYGMLDFPRADVYDLAGTVGFTGTPLPGNLFDAEDDVRLGWLGPERFGRLRPR
jgi:hypothetical protein